MRRDHKVILRLLRGAGGDYCESEVEMYNCRMYKIILSTALGVCIVVVGIFIYTTTYPTDANMGKHSQTGTICTPDTKTCPDGSTVERHGSSCEFSTCPGV